MIELKCKIKPNDVYGDEPEGYTPNPTYNATVSVRDGADSGGIIIEIFYDDMPDWPAASLFIESRKSDKDELPHLLLHINDFESPDDTVATYDLHQHKLDIYQINSIYIPLKVSYIR